MFLYVSGLNAIQPSQGGFMKKIDKFVKFFEADGRNLYVVMNLDFQIVHKITSQYWERCIIMD